MNDFDGSSTTSPRTGRRPTTSPPGCPRSSAPCSSCLRWRRRNTRSSRSTTLGLRGSSPKADLLSKPDPFTYTGEVTNVPFPDTGDAPSLLNRSYTITAEVEIPQGGAEGMLVTDGGRFAGYGILPAAGPAGVYLELLGLERVKWQGKEALAPGKHTLEFDWKYDGPGLGKGGAGTLTVDGNVVDTHPMPHSLPITLEWDEYLQRRHRHRHSGRRRGLPGAVPLHRQDQQADSEARAGGDVSRTEGQNRDDWSQAIERCRQRHVRRVTHPWLPVHTKRERMALTRNSPSTATVPVPMARDAEARMKCPAAACGRLYFKVPLAPAHKTGTQEPAGRRKEPAI